MATEYRTENIYKCQSCGPLEDIIAEGTISVSKTEQVIDYLDCELRCPICGADILKGD